MLLETAGCLCKTTEYWYPEHDRSIVWYEPEMGIAWPMDGEAPQLALKDASTQLLAQAESPEAYN